MIGDLPPIVVAELRPHCDKRNYHCRFRRLPEGWRTWAHATSECESHNVTGIHDASGVHHGAFQFLLPTWQAAGGTGDPHTKTWAAQAFRAVHWAKVAGQNQWACP